MAVRFKFRSSAASDAVDLGSAASISVRDLRSQILRLTNPRLSRDFDLLISDALSNRPYDDDELQIPAGSDVIVKRVPTGRSAPSNVDLVRRHELLPSEKIDLEKFVDFGNDLNPACEALLLETHADVASSDSTSGEMNVADPRCSEISISRHQNIEGSDLSEAKSKEIVGENCNNVFGIEEEKTETELKFKIEEHKMLDEGIAKCTPVMLNLDPPMELRCSLCNTIFKEAVMIPCCQHSFCNKCIRCSLVEIRKCPKCSSIKCTVEDLLPNLSLRQAIEHFLEAQTAIDGLENLMPKYAPDGESGIQTKEPSFAVSVRQQELQVPHSPSATGKGSNQIVAGSTPEKKRAVGINIRLDADKSVNINQINLGTIHNENSQADKCKQMAGFPERGNSAKLPRSLPHKVEANFPIHQRKGLSINAADGSGAIAPPIKPRKGDRNCYMCGSPDHLIRDCPVASNTYPGDVAFPGQISAYGAPFWYGSPYPHFQPYASMYAPPGIMPFDSRVLPVARPALASYMPSLYSGMPAPYFMRTGGFPYPMFDGSGSPLIHTEFRDPHSGEQHHKIRNEGTKRELDYYNRSDDYHPDEIRRETHEQKHRSGKQTSGTFSDDDKKRVLKKHQQDEYYSPTRQKSYNTSDEDIHRSIDKKHENHSYPSTSGRDERSYCSEKSISEVHDSSEYSTKHNRGERSKHHNRSGSKKHEESKGKGESGSSKKSYHRTEKERMDHKMLRNKHHSHSDSKFESDFSEDRRKMSKEKEVKKASTGEWFENDRWEMVDGLDNDYEEAYYRKRRRTH